MVCGRLRHEMVRHSSSADLEVVAPEALAIHLGPDAKRWVIKRGSQRLQQGGRCVRGAAEGMDAHDAARVHDVVLPPPIAEANDARVVVLRADGYLSE
jgi:hypothetical protein